jgi:hypothetical protein
MLRTQTIAMNADDFSTMTMTCRTTDVLLQTVAQAPMATVPMAEPRGSNSNPSFVCFCFLRESFHK